MKIINIVSLVENNDIIDAFVEYDNGRIMRCYSYHNIEQAFQEFLEQEHKSITELYQSGYIQNVAYTKERLHTFNKLVEYSVHNSSMEMKTVFFPTGITLLHLLVNCILIGNYDFSDVIGFISIIFPNKISLAKDDKYFKTNKIKNLRRKQILLKSYLAFLLAINIFTFSKEKVLSFTNQSYHDKVFDIDLDEFVDEGFSIDEIRKQKVEKIFTDFGNNPYLSQEDIEILMGLKKYYLDNPYLDLDSLYQKMMTIRIYDKYAIFTDIGGDYIRGFNVIHTFQSLDGETMNRDSILFHEGIHMTGNFHNRVLREGMTSQLEHEYYEDEAFLGIDGYFEERGCTRVIGYLVGPDLMLEAYSQNNQKIIDDELIKIYGSKEKVNKIYFDMQLYCEDRIEHDVFYNDLCNGNLTDEQKEMIPSYIFLSTITTEVHFENLFYLKEKTKVLK